jgi:hypothetical protein
MNALTRFYRLGAEDADRRVAAALAPAPTTAVDRYLEHSRLIKTIDRATRVLQDWWFASASCRLLSRVRDGVVAAPFGERYRALAFVLLIAVITHIALMVIQGTRAGWFWMIIPALAAAFAALLLAGSPPPRSTD